MDHHLRNTASRCRDDWQSGRHGFHDYGRQIIHAALGVYYTRQYENARRGETLPDFTLRFCTGQLNTVLQARVLNLRAQFVLERALADDLALKCSSTFRKQSAGAN